MSKDMRVIRNGEWTIYKQEGFWGEKSTAIRRSGNAVIVQKDSPFLGHREEIHYETGNPDPRDARYL